MEETEKMSTEELLHTIELHMQKVQTQGMTIGAQLVCSIILKKINATFQNASKTTLRDYKRLVKDITAFCETALSEKVNSEEQHEIIEEKSNDQNRNT